MRLVLLAGVVVSPMQASGREVSRSVHQLFDGKNLDGWHVTRCEAVLENGVLLLKSGNGFVRTDHRYADFVLDLDWKARKSEKWDSGIYFRCELPDPAKARPWPARYQVNLLQGQEGNITTLPGATSTGLVKSGEWNHFRLTVVGDQAELEINGKPAWKAGGIEARTGYIGLQAEVPGGGQFEFRDIRIAELGYQSLFNGKDLAGWTGADADAASCWKVEDALLICTGQKGPWLRSEKQYADFNLRLEYQLLPAGNSGVYARVPADGNHHGKGSGLEIQILDDSSDKYRDLKPYQYSASVYDIAGAEPKVSKKPGEWNTLEIDCRGPNYIVSHNGVMVVNATVEKFPALTERRLEGYLGLQNHSERVAFRNLRVGPPLPR